MFINPIVFFFSKWMLWTKAQKTTSPNTCPSPVSSRWNRGTRRCVRSPTSSSTSLTTFTDWTTLTSTSSPSTASTTVSGTTKSLWKQDNVRWILTVSQPNRVLTPQINHISMKFPNFAVMPQRDQVKDSMFCNQSTVSNCVEEFCECLHVMQVP